MYLGEASALGGMAKVKDDIGSHTAQHIRSARLVDSGGEHTHRKYAC